MLTFALAATAASAGDAGFRAEQCASPGCESIFASGVAWTVGSRQPGRKGEVVRLDGVVNGALASVWLAVDGGRIVDHRDGGPTDLLPAGTPPQVAPWVAPALAAILSGDPTSVCTEAFVETAHDSCARLAEQARRPGVALRPIATHARGDRHVAVVDWMADGAVRDRIWLYAVGAPDRARLDGVDESPRHAAAFLAGELPGTADPPRHPALEAWGARFVEAPDPSTRVPRGSEVVGSGAIGSYGALCLDTPAGGMVVTVAAAGDGWRHVRSAYKAGCRLSIADLLP